jgi:hypothetical protein
MCVFFSRVVQLNLNLFHHVFVNSLYVINGFNLCQVLINEITVDLQFVCVIIKCYRIMSEVECYLSILEGISLSSQAYAVLITFLS